MVDARKPFRKFFAQVGPPLVGAMAEHITAHTARLADAMTALATGRPPLLDVLRYAEVVEFFVVNQDAAADSAAGALVREQHPDGTLVRLCYLDADGRPLVDRTPHRSYLVREFDAELAGLLGTRNVVVFT